jgi:glutathione S-transferase
MGIEFVPLEKAARMKGVRVTFLPGVPALFSECLKNFLDAKKVPYTRALHPAFGKDQSFLYKLTSQTSLPTMLHDDERPRNSWIEQVVLADKLGGPPSLIPEKLDERVLLFGLMNELLGEDGLMWRKRLLFGASPFTEKYGHSDQAATEAPARIAEVVGSFAARIDAQRAAGSRYLLGKSLTALDIYFATVTYMICPPGEDMLPRTKQNRGLLQGFAANPPEVQAIVDGEGGRAIREYRDYILQTHCVMPAQLGGTPLPAAKL